MEIDELKMMWQAHESKIEKSLQLNLHCVEMIQKQKVKSVLTPLFWLRLVEFIFHVLIIWWLVGFAFDHFNQIGYVLAALPLLIFYVLAGVNCIRQVIIIQQINYNLDVIHLQALLEKLQTHVVNYLRLTFLVIPTYLAYPVILLKASGFDILANINGDWWKSQVIFCLALLPLCLWLYKEVSYKNIQKKWVRKIVAMAGTRVVRSMDFLKELEMMKR